MDELLKSKQAGYILEDNNFKECAPIFANLQVFADKQINNYRLEFKDGLLQTEEKAGLTITLDLPQFSILKGIDGK